MQKTNFKVEILIHDDCSTDGTYDHLKEKYKDNDKVTVYKNEVNMGCGKTRKKAMDNYVSGEYVLFLDDDDKFILDTYFEKAINLFNKYDNLSFVASNHYIRNTMDNSLIPMDLKYGEIIDNRAFFLNFASEEYKKPIPSDTIFSVKAIKNDNYKNIKIINDTTIFLTALTQGKCGFVNEFAIEYTIHGNNISFDVKLDFIIDNLNEKVNIYNQIDELSNFNFTAEEKKQWLSNQLDVTIIYYLKGSHPSYFKFFKLMLWYKRNVNNKEKMKEFKQIYKEAIKKGKQI